MHVKYQVFISSTFEDLKDERRTVIEQVLNLGHIPVGMELFQAGDLTQWEYIKQRILECDYYVVIIGERYGSEGPEGKSYTQMEYEFAINNNVPVSAFPLHADARKNWPKDKVQWDKRDKLELFRQLCESRMAKHWKNGDELAARVTTALVETMARQPRVGWVRADSVAPEAALQEIAKLSEERRLLQDEVEKLRKTSTSLSPPPDIKHRINLLSSTLSSNVYKDSKITNDISMLELFSKLSRVLALRAPDHVIQQHMYEILKIDEVKYYSVDITSIIAELSFHGLIKIDTGGNRKAYEISEYGKEVLMYSAL